MSYRELTMIDVREVLRRWQAGQSARQIARDAMVDRKTVARYIATAERLALPRDRALDDGEVHEVAQREQARAVPDVSAERRELERHKDRIVAWLGAARPLRLSKVHVLLCRDGVEASYATLRRFAIEELDWHKKDSTVRVEDAPPGQEAQIDFGKMGILLDPETDKRRVLWALVVVLSFSRYMFVWPSFLQTTAAVCEGLDRAFRFFGGMPRTIIPDNMSAIVASPDALSPRLTEAFADYAQTRGLFVDPARVRAPKDKPRVENQVAYVRESWFDGETFTSLDDARARAEDWCRDVAGARVHGTTRRVPRDEFERVEKAAMLAPPTEPFDVPIWTTSKIHPDHHIEIAKALYSVPSIYRRNGALVRVRADRSLVRIYAGTTLVKTHARQPPGGRATDPADYPVGKSAYALRSVDALLKTAEGKGVHVGQYAERLLAGPLPWTRMRQGYALLRLCEKYGDGRVEAVCQTALSFDVVDVARITKMLKRAATPAVIATTDSDGRKVVQLSLPRFARPQKHFETRGGGAGEGGAS
jgi:transposase